MLQWHITVTAMLFRSQLFIKDGRVLLLKEAWLITSKNSASQISLHLKSTETTEPGKFFKQSSENISPSKPHKMQHSFLVQKNK